MGKMCGANIDESFPWPTCSMHYDMVTAYSDFYSWVWYSLYDPHGPVHIWIGGVLDCENTYEEIASLVGADIAEELALYSFIHRKNLFRDGIFSCTGTVPVGDTPDEVRVVISRYCVGMLSDFFVLWSSWLVLRWGDPPLLKNSRAFCARSSECRKVELAVWPVLLCRWQRLAT